MTDDIDEGAWEAGAALHEEAESLALSGQLREAEEVALRAVEALEGALPYDHPDLANALATVAEIAAHRGRHAEAIDLWRRSLAIFERSRHEEVVRQMRLPALRHLARALIDAGEYADAERRVEEAIDEASQLWGADSDAVAWGYNLRGVLEKFRGRYADAESAYAKALALFRRAGVEPSPGLLHNLGGLACARGDPTRAESLCRQAIELRRSAYARDRVGLGGDLVGLGDALAGQGRHDEAVVRYREALDVYRESGHDEHPEVAVCLLNLADSLAACGAAQTRREAERTYHDAITRMEAIFGPRHHELAVAWANLAVLLREEGRVAEAALHLARAWAIAEPLPRDHPIRVGCATLVDGDASEPRASFLSPRGVTNGPPSDTPCHGSFTVEVP